MFVDVSGIGIVNAIEVVNAFPEEDGFHKFREWVESPDPAIFGKVGGQPGSCSKKKGSKASMNAVCDSNHEVEGNFAADSNSLLEDEDVEARNGILKIKQTFMNKHVCPCSLLGSTSFPQRNYDLLSFPSPHGVSAEKCKQKLASPCFVSK